MSLISRRGALLSVAAGLLGPLATKLRAAVTGAETRPERPDFAALPHLHSSDVNNAENYTYDSLGRLTSMSEPVTNETSAVTTYCYDDLGRLVEVRESSVIRTSVLGLWSSAQAEVRRKSKTEVRNPKPLKHWWAGAT